MAEPKSSEAPESDDDTKRKFREALDRKMAKSPGGSDHKSGGGNGGPWGRSQRVLRVTRNQTHYIYNKPTGRAMSRERNRVIGANRTEWTRWTGWTQRTPARPFTTTAGGRTSFVAPRSAPAERGLLRINSPPVLVRPRLWSAGGPMAGLRVVDCRRPDSNRHGYFHILGILSPLCLPIPPLRQNISFGIFWIKSLRTIADNEREI